MCGLTGFVHTGAEPVEPLRRTLAAMTQALTHRGPDQDGLWLEGPAALGHRRLSVLDVSEAGSQPMISADGRYVIAYNGEIYNFDALRQHYLEPDGVRLRSQCDTEVLLELIARRGLEFTLPKLNGMFAFAVWDREGGILHLIRDRIGIKPLYWAMGGPYLMFGSELKSMLRHPEFCRSLSAEGLLDYFHSTFVSGEKSIFDGCHKVRAGEHVSWSAGTGLIKRRYWSLDDIALARPDSEAGPSFGAATDRLEALLDETMRDQVRADVPLGAFLSGGVDSSTVVAILRKTRPVQTFSIGYTDASFDESANARAIAEHLETDHTEFILTPDDITDIIPKLPQMYDEPYADPSQIPTHMVSRLAAANVTVALSGDGGDELFAGYERYQLNTQTWGNVERVPRAMRKPLAAFLDAVPPDLWRIMLKPLLADASQSIPHFSRLLNYPRISAYHRDANYLGIGAASRLGQAAPECDSAEHLPRFQSALDELLYLDQTRRLPDNMLTKVDRASMAVSLEVRVPLLDNRILDCSWSLPDDQLIRSGERKAVLRNVLARHVPRPLFDTPKKGFHIPLRDWLGDNLRGWAEDLLNDELANARDYLDAKAVRKLWARYLAGAKELINAVWIVLMFLAWNRALRENAI